MEETSVYFYASRVGNHYMYLQAKPTNIFYNLIFWHLTINFSLNY